MRHLKTNDINRVIEIAKSSWTYTYKSIFSSEYIENFISNHYNYQRISNILSKKIDDYSEFLVLENISLNSIVGFSQVAFEDHWKIDKEKIPDQKIILYRIYLDPDFIGKELGNLLLERVEAFTKKKGKNCYYLHVHKENKIGLNFYYKNGFIPVNENDLKNELLLDIELKKCIYE